MTSIHRYDAAPGGVARPAVPSSTRMPMPRPADTRDHARGAARIDVAEARPTAATHRSVARTAVLATIAGIAAAAVSWVGSWVPSFGGAEGAAIMSADRIWPSLVAELSRIDVGSLVYVALLHGWIVLAGDAPGAIRLFSALAVGAAAAGVVVLVRGFASERLAVVAAVVFAVLPRTTGMGEVTAPAALATACAVWMCVLFASVALHARPRRAVARTATSAVRPGRRTDAPSRFAATRAPLRGATRSAAGLRGTTRILPWVGFGVAFAFCILVQASLVLFVLVFGVVLSWSVRGRLVATSQAMLRPRRAVAAASAQDRAVIGRWLAASGLAVAVTAPLLVLDLVQGAGGGRGVAATSSEMGGASESSDKALSALITAWFGTDAAVAVVVIGTLAALAVTFLVLARRGTLRRAMRAGEPVLVVFAATWLALPGLLLFALDRNDVDGTTAFTAPALAVLLAVAVELVVRTLAARGIPTRRRRVAAVVAGIGVAAVAVCAVPAYAAQRSPFAHGSDWAQVAGVIQRHSRPGDDIVFDEATAPLADPRIALHLYPEQFANVVDVTLRAPYVDRDGLWDTTYSVPDVAARIADGDGRVWVVEPRDSSRAAAGHLIAQLHTLGFVSTANSVLHSDTVALLTRGTTQ